MYSSSIQRIASKKGNDSRKLIQLKNIITVNSWHFVKWCAKTYPRLECLSPAKQLCFKLWVWEFGLVEITKKS